MSKTAIIECVQNLDLEAATKILSTKPALRNVTDRQERNLLHLACSTSPKEIGLTEAAQVRMVKYLLDLGFEIDLPVGRDACTPLFFAVARARNLALVRFLLERGAKPSAAPGGGLFAAGWWEDIKILDVLIEAGAQIDIVVGATPFLG